MLNICMWIIIQSSLFLFIHIIYFSVGFWVGSGPPPWPKRLDIWLFCRHLLIGTWVLALRWNQRRVLFCFFIIGTWVLAKQRVNFVGQSPPVNNHFIKSCWISMSTSYFGSVMYSFVSLRHWFVIFTTA